MNKLYFIIITFALIMSSQSAHSQGVNSPYSRYGFGLMTDKAMGFNKGMGGVALGFRDGKQINCSNPASYSAVDSMSALFDLGLSVYNGNYKMENLQQNAKNASFDYFAFQFRAAKNLGLTVGIMPITNTNYSFSSVGELIDPNEDYSSSYAFSGEGGLHQVYMGLGWRIFKPLSVGVNGSIIWGNYEHNMKLVYSESSIYSLQRKYNATINTYAVDFGLQYDFKLSKTDKVTLGLTYGLGHNINNRAYRSTNTINSSSTIVESTVDTLKNAFQWPMSVGAGLTYYHKNRLRMGADFTLQKWSKAKFPSQNTTSTTDAYYSSKGQLNDMWKIAAGFDYIPNPYSQHYFQRATYKLGGYYSKSYAKSDLTGTVKSKPYEIGLSAGIGLPITNNNIWHNSPKVNISLQYVRTNIPYLSASKGTECKLTENYIRLCIGVSFNERWFYKWKVQ